MQSVPEHIIIRFLEGTASEEELKQLKDWLQQDQDHLKLFNESRDIWYSGKLIPEEMIHSGWDMLLNKIKTKDKKRIPSQRFKMNRSWLHYAAATVTGILISSAIWLNIMSEKELITQHTVSNQHGVMEFMLPDSSVTWMHSNGRINFTEDFKGEERFLTLAGDAYFDIRKNTGKPFIVRTENIEIRVTGTEFFVQSAYSPNVMVTLISGGVTLAVSNEKNRMANPIQLSPGQQATINKKSGEMNIHDIDTSYYITWKNGSYRFTDERLEDICAQLTIHYQLQIDIAPSLKDKRFTGRVTTEHTLVDVMEIFYTSYPILYHIEGNTMYITE